MYVVRQVAGCCSCLLQVPYKNGCLYEFGVKHLLSHATSNKQPWPGLVVWLAGQGIDWQTLAEQPAHDFEHSQGSLPTGTSTTATLSQKGGWKHTWHSSESNDWLLKSLVLFVQWPEPSGIMKDPRVRMKLFGGSSSLKFRAAMPQRACDLKQDWPELFSWDNGTIRNGISKKSKHVFAFPHHDILGIFVPGVPYLSSPWRTSVSFNLFRAANLSSSAPPR